MSCSGFIWIQYSQINCLPTVNEFSVQARQLHILSIPLRSWKSHIVITTIEDWIISYEQLDVLKHANLAVGNFMRSCDCEKELGDISLCSIFVQHVTDVLWNCDIVIMYVIMFVVMYVVMYVCYVCCYEHHYICHYVWINYAPINSVNKLYLHRFAIMSQITSSLNTHINVDQLADCIIFIILQFRWNPVVWISYHKMYWRN